MKRKIKTKLSFFEAVWMWIDYYMQTWDLKVRGNYERGVTINLMIFQTCNMLVIYFIALKTGLLPLGKYSHSAIVFVGLLAIVYILDVLLIERRLDHLVEIHNALTQRERDRDRLLTWIYVVGSIVLLIAVVLVQEFVYNR